MNVQRYIKMLLYKISQEYEVTMTTIEKYDDKNEYKYKRTIILTIGNILIIIMNY